MHLHTVHSLSTDKSLEVSVNTISSTSLHINAQLPPGLGMVEVKCTLTSKENPSYIRTVSLNDTTDKGAQRLTDNLVPYTNYTATCLMFKDGVDQCYIGSDTTQTYTDSEYCPCETPTVIRTLMVVAIFVNFIETEKKLKYCTTINTKFQSIFI